MTRFTVDQLGYAASRPGYLDRPAAIEFLNGMDIKMSVGHWSAGDFCDRFAPPGYHSDDPGFGTDFEAQCRRTKAAGVDAIEIHQSVFEKTLNGDLDSRAIERAQNGYLAEYAGVPVHKFDVNDARQGRNDQDCMFGTLSIPESVEYLYTTFLRNYQGWYSQDQFTYREDPTRAIERSMINFANLCLKAVRILAQQPALDKARRAGTGPDVLDVISPVLVG